MPFLSEKLWQQLFDNKTYLMMQTFNTLKIDANFTESKNKVEKIISIITSVRNIRAELNISYKIKINLILNIKDSSVKQFVKNFEVELTRLLKIEKIIFEKIYNKKNAAHIILSDISLLIPLEGIINTNQELANLNNKKIEATSKLNSIMIKLENKNFINKAPSHVIDDFNKQKIDLKSSIEKIEQIINTIT